MTRAMTVAQPRQLAEDPAWPTAPRPGAAAPAPAGAAADATSGAAAAAAPHRAPRAAEPIPSGLPAVNAAAPRLNIFQRVVRQWERLHPYNAAQAMRLRRRYTYEQVTQAWRSALADLGLGPIHFQGDRVIYELCPSAVAMSSPAELEEADCLQSFLSRQMNRPWEEDTLPFRPFVQMENGSGQIIGVVYRHCASDSYSIRLILREWLIRLHDPSRARKAPLLPARRGYWHHYGPFAADWSFIGSLLKQVNASVRMKKCRRLLPPRRPDVDVRFREYRTPEGLLPALRVGARRRGAKVNDLFLAALFRTCSILAPLEPTRRRRHLCIGTIVDLRNLAGRSPGDAFGLFLGFTSTFARPGEVRDAERLVQAVAGQSRRHRESQIPQASQIALTTALLAALCHDDAELQGFYRKRFPLVGGISNVLLNGTWAEAMHREGLLAEYVRVSPTGPFMPLVVTPTTLGNRLHLGVTTRTAMVDDPTADRIAEEFLAQLQQLA